MHFQHFLINVKINKPFMDWLVYISWFFSMDAYIHTLYMYTVDIIQKKVDYF